MKGQQNGLYWNMQTMEIAEQKAKVETKKGCT
jgi:hypothetical protein